MKAVKKLVERDRELLWHPLTQHQTAAAPLAIVKAKGAMLYDESGKAYIDGIASWYTSMYGHGNSAITKAMAEQMEALDFVMFSGFTHEPAITLAEHLMAILPENQAKVFFNDNGSTAIEAAIKMCLQYYHNKEEKRDTLIAFEGGFHGDTFGAMSASGISSYNGPFEAFLLEVERIPVPTAANIDAVLEQLEGILSARACAAFVFEPLIQGAAGMKMHEAAHLDRLISKCRDHQVLCVGDEIMTGFGKTGKNFASDHLDNKPDILCLGKAWTAGMFPLSITSCTQAVFDAFLSARVEKGFFHAHTFSAHPIGCAAAIAGLRLLNSEHIRERRSAIANAHLKFAERLEKHPNVAEIRCKGVVLAVDFKSKRDRYGSFRDELYTFCMDRGVILRPLGNTLYTLPPYTIEDAQLTRIYEVIESALNSF